jgi:uncharacterized protein (DUF885 family)
MFATNRFCRLAMLATPFLLVSVAAQAQSKTLVQTPAAAGQNLTPAQRSAALKQLFHEIWEDRLKRSPEFASSIGDKRYNDQLSDLSPRAFNEEIASGRQFLVQLASIDTTGLSEQEKLSAELMTRELVQQEQAARFKEWELPVNQFHGVHTDLPSMVVDLSFTDEKDYDDYIARLKKIPAQIRQVSENLQSGIDDGRVQPAYLMEKVAVQTEELANQTAQASPFALPLKHFPATLDAPTRQRITADLLAAIQEQVLPAYARFARFMRAVEIPAGRKDPGVWATKDGDAYYAFCVRRSTTLDKTPAEIHQIGLDEVKRDEAEMLAIVKKLGFADIKSFGAAMAADPKQHPTSKQDLLDRYRKYEAQMQPKLPELFSHLPKSTLEVVEMPEYLGKDQASAWYAQGTADGSRPGRVNINTYNFAQRALAPIEAVAYHEGIPGHHLQISTAQELTGLPEFRRYAGFTAFVEGWALYSERLGKEIGFYQDPVSDYGRLEADIWRAIRLVVDTGVHSEHWTRQQMVDYFHAHSAIDETNVQAEVDRYIAWPGQALGYKMGQLKILELRGRAQTALGPKFDLRAFHDEVIDAGALPLDILEERVNAWIRVQSGQRPLSAPAAPQG